MEIKKEQKTLAIYENTKIRLDYFKALTGESTDSAITTWLDNIGVPSVDEIEAQRKELQQ